MTVADILSITISVVFPHLRYRCLLTFMKRGRLDCVFSSGNTQEMLNQNVTPSFVKYSVLNVTLQSRYNYIFKIVLPCFSIYLWFTNYVPKKLSGSFETYHDFIHETISNDEHTSVKNSLSITTHHPVHCSA